MDWGDRFIYVVNCNKNVERSNVKIGVGITKGQYEEAGNYVLMGPVTFGQTVFFS